MIPFSAPVADILFTLQHVAGVGTLPQWDDELCPDIIRHFADFADSEIAPTDEPGDRQGCRLENGRVLMPDVYQPVFASYIEQGWSGLTIDEQYGGQGMGASLQAAIVEIFTGSCHALQMICGLVPGANRTLMEFGSESQRQHYLPLLADGTCLSTMCLSEPGAGSDLSRVRTRAVQTAEGWRLNGEKIFISGGGQNLSDNVFHLVLARSGEMNSGVRGLSLFACLTRTEDGKDNGLSVARIEEKMGIHGSPTCQLVFDNTVAELIGAEGEGLRAMFTMMNHARLDVALQGVAHAARAHQIAQDYANQRLQGRKSDGSPAYLSDHADVQRMLNTQDALALGSRALCHETLVILEAGNDADLVEFLTPVCKVFCTEAGIQCADLGIQTLGGYGYLTEYRVEQTLRDARITAIYEGANGIHCLTLATRLLHVNGGASWQAFQSFVEELAQYDNDNLIVRALDQWKLATTRLQKMEDPAGAAHAYMQLTANLAYHGMWCKMASVKHYANSPERIACLFDFVKSRSRPLFDYWHSLIMHN